jgi:hypothetical protein
LLFIEYVVADGSYQLRLEIGQSVRLRDAVERMNGAALGSCLSRDYSLSCGSCTRELWSPAASLPVGKALPPAQKAPSTAPPTRVGGLLRQGSRPGSQARSHTKVSSSRHTAPAMDGRLFLQSLALAYVTAVTQSRPTSP